MKLLITLCFVVSTTLVSFAQTSAINTLFNKFSGGDNITEINVSSKMFALFGYIDSETKEDQEALDAIKSIKSLYLISTEDKNEADKMRSTSRYINKKGFEPLMTVKDGDDNINFMIQEENGIITELIMLVDSDSNFLVMSIIGNIDLEQISKLSNIKINGLDNLKNVKK